MVDICDQCGDENALIFWKCEWCQMKKFCTKCRNPTIFKNSRCPLYHKLEIFENNKEKEKLKCSLCSKIFKNFEGFRDKKCNYAVCNKCKERKSDDLKNGKK